MKETGGQDPEADRLRFLLIGVLLIGGLILALAG